MKYIIWGTSQAYSDKIDYIDEKDIVAYVERKGRIIYRGVETIFPEEICEYDYDYIVIMSRSYLEIAHDIVNMGIDFKKILPAINLKPMLSFEAEYIADDVFVGVDSSGNLVWNFRDGSIAKVESKEELVLVREKICCEKNSQMISGLQCQPVGKLFGSNRGGSIVRYYIDDFIKKNQDKITGSVLEIGDRHYTQQYGKSLNGPGYVLHFNKTIDNMEYDFEGDLCDGTGMKKNMFDCVILTQVLMYLRDIDRVADILIDSLKENGVLLISVAGIANQSHLDTDRYDYYWNFTEASISKMFDRKDTECDVYSVGNCKAACAFLQGMSSKELTEEELEYRDKDYPLLVFAVVKKTQKLV